MKEYLRLHSLVFNQPHMCTPEYAETVLAVLSDKLNIQEGMFTATEEAREAVSASTVGGVYTLPILGSMVHRGGSLDALSGISSYSSIQGNIQAAIEDPNVKAIMLEMDSPGGAVAGAFDLRDFIMEAKEQKPIYAYARDTMASAAYLIGSAATKVYGSQTASVGSIGVVAMHVDQSARNKAAGIKPTFVTAGAYKSAGNPHEPLKGEALNYLQESVNNSYDMFVNAVVEARGLDEETIRGTEARVYRGEQAAEIGLIDGVMSYEDAMEELAGISQGRVITQTSTQRGTQMATEDNTLQADLDATKSALADLQAKHENLQAAVIGEGYTITAEGISREEEAEAPEMIEVAGVMTDKASLPTHVVEALEANAKEKAEAALREQATALLPHFEESAAMSLVDTFADAESVMTQLKAADKLLGQTMEETGETTVAADMADPQEKMDALVTAYMEEHNVGVHKARVQVMETAEGRKLDSEIRKGA